MALPFVEVGKRIFLCTNNTSNPVVVGSELSPENTYGVFLRMHSGVEYNWSVIEYYHLRSFNTSEIVSWGSQGNGQVALLFSSTVSDVELHKPLLMLRYYFNKHKWS